jgi:hypothetical protein
MLVPVALLLAAESIAAKVEKDRTSLRGVLLHQVDPKIGRVVGCDGPRLFVGSYSVGDKPPSGMKTGIMLPAADLKARVSMIAKVGDTKLVQVSHAKGDGHCTLSDQAETMAFRIECAGGDSFPNYEGVFGAKSFSDLNDEGETKAKAEWTPVGFNSRQLRHCGDLAKILEAGLDKKDRSDNGMVIRMFDGGDNLAPKVFDFVGYPGAVLVISALPAIKTSLPAETAAVLAPAVKLTVAALRAHVTRNMEWAAEATDEARKAEFAAKAEGFRQRIAAIMARAPVPALEAPKKAEKTAPVEQEKAEATEVPEAPVEPPKEAWLLTRAEKAAATRRRKKEVASGATASMA